MRIPCASARSPARRITGPSASGSENGKPISTMSAPPSTAASASAGVSRPGHQVDDERLLLTRVPDARAPGRGPCRRGPRGRRGRARPRAPPARASAWAGSSAGMIPSVSASRRNAVERLVVRRAQVLDAAGVAQRRVLGADARVVEAGRDRVRVQDLAVRRRRAPTSVRRAARPAAPAAEAGRARGLDADDPHVRRRRGSPRTCRSRSSRRRRTRPRPPGSRSSASRICSRASRPITDCSSRTIAGIRVRADAGADQVVRRLDVRDPVADRLARRLLERLRAELDRAHLGAEQAHPLDVRPLAAHVLGAHVDDALEAEARADGRRRDAVLAGARLGDDPVLAEPAREHRLAERVVELVRAGVQQVLALEVDALAGGEPLRERERRRPAGVVAPEPVELRPERRDPPAPPPSRPRARRAPGSASPGRSGRRSRRRRRRHRAASTNARTRS